MMKIALTTLIATLTLSGASLYDDNYSLKKQPQVKGAKKAQYAEHKELDGSFFLGDFFDKIIRYEPVFFDGESISSGQESIDKLLKDLEAQDLNRSRITVIGYTNESDDPDADKAVRTNAFIDFFQNIATHKGNDKVSDINLSKKRSEVVLNKLVDENVSESIIYKEMRGGDDPLYTEGTSKGIDLNNRVELALYVIGDEDKDGVLDPYDRCPKTFPGLEVDKFGCAGSINLQVNFKLDSSDVSGDDNSSVEAFANFLIDNPPYDAVIVGHTDKQGRAEYNVKLSERRAKTVLDMLVKMGVDRSRLKFEGKGFSEPIIDEDTPEAYAKNRRIEAHYFIRDSEKKKMQKEVTVPKLRQEPQIKK